MYPRSAVLQSAVQTGPCPPVAERLSNSLTVTRKACWVFKLRLTWRAPCTQRSMAVVAWLAVSLVFFRLDLAHGLYFHMGETEKKCFIEEIPDETMVIGEFGDP